MADKIIVANNSDAAFVEVDAIPGGYSNDGIFYKTVDGKHFKIANDGTIRAIKAGVKFDGTDQTSRINTILAHSDVHELIFDGYNKSITISGTVTVPAGKKIVFKNKCKIVKSGSGAWVGGLIECDALKQCFGSTLSVTALENRIVSARWFGASPNAFGFDNSPMLQTAVDCVTGKPFDVLIPAGADGYFYYCVDTITLPSNVTLKGDFATIYNPISWLQFDYNTKGLYAPSGAAIHHLRVSQYIDEDALDTTAHGVHVEGVFHFENVNTYHIAGNGIHIVAKTEEGKNADNSVMKSCNMQDCHNGLYTEGGDANIIIYENCRFADNRRWGSYHNDLLGGHLHYCHWLANGHSAAVAVTYGGSTYTAINPIGTSNVNHQPDISPTYWQIATTSISGSAAWDSGTDYESGGCFYIVDPNANYIMTNPYTEAFQGQGRLNARSLSLNGINGCGVVGGCHLAVVGGVLTSNSGIFSDLTLAANDDITSYNGGFKGGKGKGILFQNTPDGGNAFGLNTFDGSSGYMAIVAGGSERMAFLRSGVVEHYSVPHASDDAYTGVYVWYNNKFMYRTLAELATDLGTGGGGATDLDGLTDVVIVSPSNGEVLKYNSTSGKWENQADAGGSALVINNNGAGRLLISNGGTSDVDAITGLRWNAGATQLEVPGAIEARAAGYFVVVVQVASSYGSATVDLVNSSTDNTFGLKYAGGYIIGNVISTGDTYLNTQAGPYNILFKINSVEKVRLSSTGVLKYASDVSASYDNRSLVDKEYVDNAVAAGGGVQTLNVQYTDVANSGTSETDLMSYTLPAGQLAANGDRIEIVGHFQTAANANNKTLKFYFGAYSHTQSPSTIASGVSIYFKVTIIRTGAATQRVSVEYFTGFSTSVTVADSAETLSGAIALKFTGQSAAASSDITQKTMSVTYYPYTP